MSETVVQLRPADNPDVVLEAAKGEVEQVLVLGYDSDGELYAASSSELVDGGNILWLIETFKQKLLNLEFLE